MGDLLQPMHLLVIGVIVFLLFGARRLPELGKGLGEGLKGFKEGIKGITDPAPASTLQSTAAPVAPGTGTPSTAPIAGKATYRCPGCSALVTASAPNPGTAEDKGFCPECGKQFDKKTSLA